jgi:selenocysteine-specific elongation factor
VPIVEYLVRQGTAARVGRERYYDREALERLREEIVDEVGRLGRAAPAELRARTGLTRKYLIPVLEWLDGAGFTVRDGDARRLGPAAGGGNPA